jgi:hypothetical protein
MIIRKSPVTELSGSNRAAHHIHQKTNFGDFIFTNLIGDQDADVCRMSTQKSTSVPYFGEVA